MNEDPLMIPYDQYSAVLACCARLVGLVDAALGAHEVGCVLPAEALRRALACRDEVLAELARGVGLDPDFLKLQLLAAYAQTALEKDREVKDG